MTVREVLTMATQFLSIEDEMKDYISSDDYTSGNKQFLTLYNALNLVYQELASDYYPLTKTQKIDVQNNKIFFSDLGENVLDVLSIKSSFDGLSYKFRVCEDYLYVGAKGEVEIVYSYIPTKLFANDSIENFGGRISPRTFALGVVYEYCFVSGLYEDAAMWHKRFCDSIKAGSTKRKNIIIKERGWV